MLVEIPPSVKKILAALPRDDYPVLDTFKLVSIWLHYALDQSEVSMRSVLKRLNIQGEKVHISTFSKASKKRSSEIFQKIFEDLRKKLNKGRNKSGCKFGLFPLDSTVVILTSKLLHFVLRINRNIRVEKLENGKNLLGSGKNRIEARVVQFYDPETGSEFRLVTNLPSSEEGGVDDKEISEIYRHRWQIELLWKFLKMHLKLDQLITKNLNGIEIQIYVCLIAYLILKLIKIPKEFGEELLDKLRYLHACVCAQISYVHWLPKLVFF